MTKILENIAKSLNVDSNTMVSTLTTILIFGLGFLINGLVQKLNQFRKRSILRKNGRYTIKELIVILKKQGIEYENFSKTLSFKNEPRFKVTQRANPFIEIWRMLNFEIYFDAYCSALFRRRKKIRRKALNKVYLHLKNIENTEIRAYKDFEKLIEKYNQYNNDWNNNADIIRKVFIHNLNVPDKSSSHIDFTNEFGIIMEKWSKITELWNFELIIKKIFNDLIILIDKYKGDQQLLIIANAINNCKFAKLNLDELFLSYKNQFITFSNNYKASAKILKKCIEIL